MSGVDIAPPPTSTQPPVRPKRPGRLRRENIGWLFVLPFLVVFVAFLVAPLIYAGYLSLFTKGLATTTHHNGSRK